MSHKNFQKALAQISRFPNLKGQELNQELDKYQLTQEQVSQLIEVVESKYFQSFIKNEQYKRFSLHAKSVFTHLTSLIGKDKFFSVFTEEFEKTVKRVSEDQITSQFKDFILNRNWSDINIGQKLLSDIINYEYNTFLLVSGHIDSNWSPRKDSLIKQETPFIIHTYNFNILEIMEHLPQIPRSLPENEETATTILMLREKDEKTEELAEYEVDTNVFNFLSNIPSLNMIQEGKELPTFYEDLVGLGVCKDLN